MAFAAHLPTTDVGSTGPVLRTVGDVGRIRLVWRVPTDDAGDWDVHGIATDDAARSWTPTRETLLATVSEPRFAHEGLGPAAQRWSYRVVPAPASLHPPLGPITATSRTSVVLSGRPVAVVGSFDGSGLELALAPTGFVHYQSTFPRDVDFRFGFDRPEVTWSYLQPGPDDAWAGRRGHRFRLRFDLDRAPEQDLDLALWLTDRHATRAGSASVLVNGCPGESLFFDEASASSTVSLPATTRASGPEPGGGPAYIEREIDRRLLRVGENIIDLVKDHGSWIAYDAVGVFARAGS
ncbi:polysaccharide lyase family protein [Rudaeicoccus suwonensis]|uniref:Polysaccharide lyase family 4-like protein n=1 Tax=Rudaeicoccus suwonensis TaxID=657409 RepID=A0A561E2Y9_9MICO|nr:polysaccharide lyase family protein [Rudaeicoccus suwonensis]TWE09973.1 polysaccharide lyase family 4-like protein [Rudaeicoccus suwonensis]